MTIKKQQSQHGCWWCLWLVMTAAATAHGFFENGWRRPAAAPFAAPSLLSVRGGAGGGDSSSSIRKSSNTFASRQRRRQAAASSDQAQDEVILEDEVFMPKTKSALERYQQEHAYSLQQPDRFWSFKAKEFLTWEQDFTSVQQGSLNDGDVTWFAGGKLNVCSNAIDRHVQNGYGDDIAMVWEGDEPGDIRRITYRELLQQVSQIANALLQKGVQKGDVVTIYMPMIPELAMTMLACSRIGAVHSVVFAGFSAEALAQRIHAAQSKVLVTADAFSRGGRRISLKDIVDEARTKLDCEELLQHVLVWERFFYNDQDTTNGANHAPTTPYNAKPKDVRMNVLVAKQRPYCPPTVMDAEDTLFILYTSGSTGQPKGLVHTTGGYALYAAMTTHHTFGIGKCHDENQKQLFACVADCGWITGHTYVVYGPLLLGATTFLFESTPLYPNPGRYWDMIQRHHITHFYTAPTAIRSLMRHGSEIPQKYDLSSLRILGTVGEPINPEAWRWYYEVIGKSKCTIVDTYWQTETGGHIITNLPGITPMKPGSCTLPFYGIDPVVLDPLDGHEIIPARSGEDIEGVLALRRPWPGMARTCLYDHERYLNVYMKPYPGYYFTGDAVRRDKDGYHFITGRVDDVVNVSGHRIGTAEIESALVAHPAVAQAAVVAEPHVVKGQAIAAFVMLDVNYPQGGDDDDDNAALMKELKNQVRTEIGPFAAPEWICITPNLPMTRSGKIMRRILRKIVTNELDTLGDTSTLADPSIVDLLVQKVATLQSQEPIKKEQQATATK